MIQRRKDLAFPLKPDLQIGIRKLRRQNLDRNLTAQSRVLRLPDLSHAAFADRADQLETAEIRFRSECVHEPPWKKGIELNKRSQ